VGLHRLWYVGGRYAYASCHWQRFTYHVLAIIDLAEPTHPEVVGRRWLPGMHTAGRSRRARSRILSRPYRKRWSTRVRTARA
jgi:hypothetical protein